FTSALKTQAAAMLVKWANWETTNGYHFTDPSSNYGDGGYVSLVMTALALNASGDSNGPSLVNQAVAYRQTYVLPLLTNTPTSLNGGYWVEGWNYGPLAIENLLLGGQALQQAGAIPNATTEQQWAGQLLQSLISEQPTASTIYDGGDGYNWPAPFPDNDLAAI